jgi:aspartyl-tRNA(Asn)/glutamyl-tRNA(Gln) amidotransferase subunit A
MSNPSLSRRALLRAGVTVAVGAPLLGAVRAAAAAPAHAANPADLSLLEVLAELDARRLSARELVDACLARIDALEATLQTFVTRTPERALAAAQRADDERGRRGAAPALPGVPVGLKDLYYTAGVGTTAGSRVLDDFVPDFDATLWVRLRDAGAGLLGKLNTHEFAYGTSTPPTRNPWDTTRNPGGSSGGSGAALAARLLPVATGSDTGGSLRLPAAVNGICALRPTYGAVSRHGVLALAWSLDTVAPMARRMADVSLLLGLVAGPDPADPTALDAPLGDLPLTAPSLDGVRVGVPERYFWDGIDAGILAVCRRSLALLEHLGATVVEVPVPASTDQVMAGVGVYEVTNLAEAASYHRGFVRSPRAARYSPEVASLLANGETITAADYLDAQRLRSTWAREWRALFTDHALDAVAHPTTPTHPLPQTPSQSFAVGVPIKLTRAWSNNGFPSLSVPVGLDDAVGLPVGLCLSGLPLEDARVLGIGVALDEAVGFWRVRPPLVEALS